MTGSSKPHQSERGAPRGAPFRVRVGSFDVPGLPGARSWIEPDLGTAVDDQPLIFEFAQGARHLRAQSALTWVDAPSNGDFVQECRASDGRALGEQQEQRLADGFPFRHEESVDRSRGLSEWPTGGRVKRDDQHAFADRIAWVFARRRAAEPDGGAGGTSGPDLAAEARLAAELLDRASEDPAILVELDDELAEDVRGWLFDLPDELAGAALFEQGLRLCTRLESLDPALALSAQARLLLAAGRMRDAAETAETLAARFAAEPALQLAAGTIVEKAGRHAVAGAMYNRALKLAEGDAGLTVAVLERLVPWLEADGRPDEGRELRAIRDELRGELEDAQARQMAGLPGDDTDLLDVNFEDDTPREAGTGRPAPDEMRIYSAMLRRIVAFAGRDEHVSERDAAPEAALGASFAGRGFDTALDDLDEDADLPVFLEWLLFDHRLADGRTFADRFAERRHKALSADERRLLDRVRSSHLSLYRVTAVSAGRVALDDLVLGTSAVVHGSELAEYARAGDVLAGRVFELDGTLFLSSALPFEPGDSERLLGLFESVRGTRERAVALKQDGAIFLRARMH